MITVNIYIYKLLHWSSSKLFFSSQNGDLGYFCSHLDSFYWAIICRPADVSIIRVQYDFFFFSQQCYIYWPVRFHFSKVLSEPMEHNFEKLPRMVFLCALHTPLHALYSHNILKDSNDSFQEISSFYT